jgi:hypothetical protein
MNDYWEAKGLGKKLLLKASSDWKTFTGMRFIIPGIRRMCSACNFRCIRTRLKSLILSEG